MTTSREQWQAVRALDIGTVLQLGPNVCDRFVMDPKRLGFLMARYAAAAKFLRDSTSILDIGTGDGFASLTFLQDTMADEVLGIDFDEELISYANTHLLRAIKDARPKDAERISFRACDFMQYEAAGHWDGVCCLDVVEHLSPDDSLAFFQHLETALVGGAVAVIGTPNILSSQYSSPHSMEGHINMYSPDRLRDEMSTVFTHVFILSMNDSVVHLGFDKMAHYLLGVGIYGL